MTEGGSCSKAASEALSPLPLRSKRADILNGVIGSGFACVAVLALYLLWRLRTQSMDDDPLLGVVVWTCVLLASGWSARIAELKGHHWLRWVHRCGSSLVAVIVGMALLDVVGVEGPQLDGTIPWSVFWLVMVMAFVVIPVGGLLALLFAIGDAKPGSWWRVSYDSPESTENV